MYLVRCREDLRRAVEAKRPDISNLVSDVLCTGHVITEEAATGTATGKRRVLFFDCRSMYVPNIREHRLHYGTHPDIFKHYFTSSDDLSQHVSELSRKVGCLDWTVTNLTLVVFDSKGRHAAMATAKVFAEICLRDEGLTLSRVTFLTHETDADCSMCHQCSFWSRASAPRNTLIARICDMYTNGLSSERDR